MVFIAAVGGGTGTGAQDRAPRTSILTVAVVTISSSRARGACASPRRHRELRTADTPLDPQPEPAAAAPFAEAFVLVTGARPGIAHVDLIVKEGLINLDLADVRTVLSGMGTAMMGTGEAAGEQRAIVASEEAIVNPLLDDVTLKGARSLLLSITGGRDLTLWEVDEAANRVRQEVDPDANIIVGATFDDGLGDQVRVSIVASGMPRSLPAARRRSRPGLDAAAIQPPAPPAEATSDFHRRGARHRREGAERDAGIEDIVVPEAHRAPGEVYIQEGPPQFSPLPPATWGKNRATNAEPGVADAARGGRPVPGVEDFPPHAQREYWAKSSENEPRAIPPEPPFVYQRQPEAPAPKTSLLRRLTGAGRPGKDDAPAPKNSSSRNGSGDGEQQVDLPVFFGRGKR
jgi:cell division protein FtsZ